MELLKLNIFQIDAFTSQHFSGNPAAVIPLDSWLDKSIMQAIASENNLSETAFIVQHDSLYELRWFTPKYEVDLCGHATLASAHMLFEHFEYPGAIIRFKTRSGMLTVEKSEDKYVMDFPLDTLLPYELDEKLAEILQVTPVRMAKGKTDLLVQLKTEQEVLDCQPNFHELADLSYRGVIVTATGTVTDIVSRCFYPAYGVNEDPVTGSAHTTLSAYWPTYLQKASFTAFQASSRGGYIDCGVNGDRVRLIGDAVTYLQGSINIPNQIK